MSELYTVLMERIRQAEAMVLATIVHTRGSTPREVGTHMLVAEDGTTVGTVGGGCGEAEVWSAAMEVLSTGLPQRLEVDLLHDEDGEGGRACGGIMYVFVERIGPDEVAQTA